MERGCPEKSAKPLGRNAGPVSKAAPYRECASNNFWLISVSRTLLLLRAGLPERRMVRGVA